MTELERKRRSQPDAVISVVLPVFNEVAVIERLSGELLTSLDACECRAELVFVNDGSTDGSTEVLDALAARDTRIKVLHLSRNFGHQAAVHAGLLHARGDAVVVMDTDMQDEPRCLGQFVGKWREGYDVVYAERRNRKEGAVKRFLFFAFYRLLNLISSTRIPNDAGNFGLVDRRVAENIAGLGEADRYYPGLRCWVGYRQVGVPVERGARHDDRPRVSWWGLARLAKTALFSFSSAPLAFFYAVAAGSLVVCLVFIGFTLYHKLVTGLAIPGWTSTIAVASFFGALNALGIGVLGEYVVRIYDQVRGRPTFIVADRRNLEADPRRLCSDEQQLVDATHALCVDVNAVVQPSPDLQQAPIE
jgi:dolichol-phosphate mannosyltransferase